MPGRVRSVAIALALTLAAVVARTAGGQGARSQGIITGIVVDTAGRPFAGASVVLDSGAPRVTVSDGRFAFANVSPGTHQVEVFAIGMIPRLTTVDVVVGRPAVLTIRFEPLTTLPEVRVIASHWQRRMIDELAARMAKGHGQFRDSTVLGRRMTMASAFAGLRSTHLRFNRGGTIERVLMGIGSRSCSATVWIDGYADSLRLNSLLPQDIAMMEVYDRPELVPYHFYRAGSCGVVVIWTKDVMP